MDIPTAVLGLTALAQETRLRVFRELVQAGPEGLNPGALAERLGTAQATLSFHLRELRQAGLISARPDGRYIYYQADFAAVQGLLDFLLENCCAGAADPACPPPAAAGASPCATPRNPRRA